MKNETKATETDYSRYAILMRFVKSCEDNTKLKCMLLDAIECHYGGEDIVEVIYDCYIAGGE